MRAPNPQTVEDLIAAAFAGMYAKAESIDCTGDEVVSACLNMALRAVIACENKECLRAGIERIWAELPPPSVLQ